MSESSKLYLGDCIEVMSHFESNSIDTIVTDPPYGLEFMGKDWDHGVPGKRFWQEVLRVCKPGAMLLAFGGTRTHHRLMGAIEDAGWEIRDCLMWLYGSGFPKSHDISKGIDKAAGAEREIVSHGQSGNQGHQRYSVDNLDRGDGKTIDGRNSEQALQYRKESFDITAPATPSAQLWDGWGTALKPAWEPIILAMKPRDGTFAHNALEWGVAGLWIDGGRIPTSEHLGGGSNSGSPHTLGVMNDDGWKPRIIPYVQPSGRWPANLILDDEAARLLDEQSGITPIGGPVRAGTQYNHSGCHTMGDASGSVKRDYIKDIGGASRFFYCPKASRRERNAGLEGMPATKSSDDGCGSIQQPKLDRACPRENWTPHKTQNNHPTVKPLALMRYLVKLTRTPTGGIVLDPFMGSGTTGIACVLEGRDFVGIDKDKDSFEIAGRRIEHEQCKLRQLSF